MNTKKIQFVPQGLHFINRRLQPTGVLIAALAALTFTSCDDDDAQSRVTNNDDLYQVNDTLFVPKDTLYQFILTKYVDSTIVPTYKSLAEAALKMRTANQALKAYASDTHMGLASAAWMKARVLWEMNEAFLFGPVGEDALDIDGHIDSWPLELEEIKKSIAAGAGSITGEAAWKLDPEVIGFHVTEYLLYRDGQTRPVAELTEAELNYLIAATDALVWDCVLAYVAWVGLENVPDTIKTVFNENPDVVAHLDNNPNYKNFANRLKTATGYSSFSAALSEISTGCADIAGEVGETKIEAPYSSHKVEDVESWYSWHSLDDYQNNIQSIKNAYLGGVDDNTRTTISLSTYVARQNPTLDANIKAKIEECIVKIKAIGTGEKSFYEVVRDQSNPTEVAAAVEACAELEDLFSSLNDII